MMDVWSPDASSNHNSDAYLVHQNLGTTAVVVMHVYTIFSESVAICLMRLGLFFSLHLS